MQDAQIFTVGNPIESKDTRLLGQLFFGIWVSNSIVLILLLRLFPWDQKHSTRNCTKFAHVIFLALNVNSRKIKKRFVGAVTQNQGIRHQRGPIS